MQSLPVLSRAWNLGSAILALVLVGCGGGGGDEDQGPVSAVTLERPAAIPATIPAPSPAAPLPTVEPAAQPQPAPAVAPEPVVAAAAPVAAAPTADVTAPVVTAPVAQQTSPPTPAPQTASQSLIGASCSVPELPVDVLAQINAARAAGRSCGGEPGSATVPLGWDERLFSAASGHSADMAGRNFFAHTTPEGRDAAQRMAAAGYGWSAAGENIAAGDTSLDAVMATWLRSDGHCRNIMNPVFTEVAVACVRSTAGVYGTYWTMVLGRR